MKVKQAVSAAALVALAATGAFAAEDAAEIQAAAPAAAPDASTAAALAKAGSWLVSQQREDGSFSNPKFPGLTAVALWGLAGASVPAAGTDEGAKFTNAVAKATDWLLGHAQEDGGIYTPVPGRAGGGLSTYNTALSLTALSFSGRTDPAFVGAVLRARSFLAASQLEGDDTFSGGFGYDKSAPHRYADLNNTTFVLEAMRRTQRFEDLRPEGEAKADLDWDAALAFAERLHNGADAGDDAGGFAYSPADAKAGVAEGEGGKAVLRSYGSITYSGLLALVYCKLDRDDPRVRSTLDWASRHWTLEENPGVGDQGLYFFYDVVGRALSASGFDRVPRPAGAGGDVDWRAELAAKVRSLQREDGSFANRNGRFWENDPVLATGYSAVTLSFAAGWLR